MLAYLIAFMITYFLLHLKFFGKSDFGCILFGVYFMFCVIRDIIVEILFTFRYNRKKDGRGCDDDIYERPVCAEGDD